MTSPNAYDSNTIEIAPPVVRCDSILNQSAGCVFADRMPVMEDSLNGPFSDLARHIWDAQVSGLPGAYPNGTPLTRTTDPNLRQVNTTSPVPVSPRSAV